MYCIRSVQSGEVQGTPMIIISWISVPVGQLSTGNAEHTYDESSARVTLSILMTKAQQG